MTKAEIQTLIDSNPCYACFGSRSEVIVNLLLKQWLETIYPDADTTVDTLINNAGCLNCYGSPADRLELALLNQIAYWTSSQGQAVSSFITRSGITDATQIAAIKTLVASANSNGWWDKCDLIYPFLGGNATAHAQNLKSPNFTITWAGAVTHNANGITGDGTTGYGDTGYSESSSSIVTQNSCHGACYIRVNGAAGRFFFGVVDGIKGTVFGNGALLGVSANVSINGQFVEQLFGNPTGFCGVTRRDAATKRLLVSTGEVSLARVSTGIPTLPVFVLCENNGGSAFQRIAANLSGMTFGSGLTFAEYQVIAADWQTFQTTLGRQV